MEARGSLEVASLLFGWNANPSHTKGFYNTAAFGEQHWAKNHREVMLMNENFFFGPKSYL